MGIDNLTIVRHSWYISHVFLVEQKACEVKGKQTDCDRHLSDTYKTHWCLFSWQGLFRETDHEWSKICIAKISVFILFLALTITACSFMIYLHLWVIARPGAFKLCELKTVCRMLSFTCDSVTKDAIWFCLPCRTSSVIKQILQIGIVLLCRCIWISPVYC